MFPAASINQTSQTTAVFCVTSNGIHHRRTILDSEHLYCEHGDHSAADDVSYSGLHHTTTYE